jgi:hypothetical protein
MVVDYAENLTNIKLYTRRLEKALVERAFDEAIELATRITVESRLLGQNAKLLNDNDGLPYQVELQRT